MHICIQLCNTKETTVILSHYFTSRMRNAMHV